MIKFFRKIRQKLLTENKFSKYLIYAIGEIVLVVIGILIALQINNWNQERIDNSKEKAYLFNLQKEITENTGANQMLVADRMDAKIESLKFAKKICENNLVVIDTIQTLNKITYGGVFGGGYPLGVRNYYDELLNTGNLQLIKNDSIKNIVAQYYSRIEFYNLRSKNYSTLYSNYIDGLRPFDRENPSLISKYDQIEMIEAFQSDKFRMLVDAEISYAYAVYTGVKSLERRAKIIKELIDKEIGREQ